MRLMFLASCGLLLALALLLGGIPARSIGGNPSVHASDRSGLSSISQSDSTGSADPIQLVRRTSAIKTSHAGQVIENLDLYVESGNAIQVSHDNVIIRNCRIHHKTGDGIQVMDAKNVTIENCEIINADPPEGLKPETSENIRNVYVYNSSGLKVENVTLRDGSTGILLDRSPGAVINHIDGYNFRGPFPRGQLVQFGSSPGGRLADFYVYNDPKNSWVEDNVSVYHSKNVRIENGVIDGNNSVTGVGVMFEGESQGGYVKNVDAIHQGNGGFASYSDEVVFENVRTFDSFNIDQGRGKPSSNGLQFGIVGSGVKFLRSTYTRPGNPNNIGWDISKAVTYEVRNDPRATPMAPIVNERRWAVGTAGSLR